MTKGDMTGRDPNGLAGPEAATYRRFATDHGITDAAGKMLLLKACEALAVARMAREKVEQDGMLVGNRPHPMLSVWRDADRAALAWLRQLHLDVLPPEAG